MFCPAPPSPESEIAAGRQNVRSKQSLGRTEPKFPIIEIPFSPFKNTNEKTSRHGILRKYILYGGCSDHFAARDY